MLETDEINEADVVTPQPGCKTLFCSATTGMYRQMDSDRVVTDFSQIYATPEQFEQTFTTGPQTFILPAGAKAANIWVDNQWYKKAGNWSQVGTVVTITTTLDNPSVVTIQYIS